MKNKIAISSIVILLDLLAFFFCPNSILIFLCQLPFSIWQIWTFKKHKIAIGLFLMIFSFCILIIVPAAASQLSELYPIYQFYQAIYPKSFFYRWMNDPPNFVYLSLPISFVLILIIECIFWMINKMFKVGHVKSQMLIFSSFFAFISLIYTIFAYISIVVPVVNVLIDEYIIGTLVYDILFKWLPFVCFYFVIRYVLKFFGVG